MCAGVLLVSAWTPLSSSFRSKMAELFQFFWFFAGLGGWKSIHQNFKCQLLKASRCSRTFDKIYVIDNCVLFHISCGLKCYLISASSMQGFLLFALIEWMDFHLGWMDFHLVCLVWMDFHPGPFLDPPTLKVQYFSLVQPTVKTKSVLKSPCT